MQKMGVGMGARWTTAMFFILSGLITASWSSRIPDVQQHMGLNDAAWGRMLFAMPLGQFCGLLGAGWLLASAGVQRILVAATIGCALILLATGLSDTRIQLVVALFALGLGRTILNLSVNTRAAEVQARYPQPILSTFHGLWSLACFAAAGIGAWMLVQGWTPYRHFGAIALLATVPAFLYAWRSPRRPHTPPERKPLLVKPDRYLALLGVITFFGMLCENVLFDWSVNFFERTVQAPKAMVTAGYTAYMLAMTTGRLLGDRLTGRFGTLPMLMVNGLLMAVGFLTTAIGTGLAAALVGFALIGLGNSIIVPVVYALASKSSRMPPAYALAAVTLIGYFGFLTGPLLTGAVAEAMGMRWAFGLFTVTGLGIALIALRLHYTASNQQPTGALT